MKYKDSQGNFQDIYVKVGDNIPVGGEMDFDGDNIPVGWEEVDNPNNYSTTEQKVGTWIDGKPIYRKVISYNNTSTIGSTNNKTDLDIPHNISNIGYCIKANGFRLAGNSDVYPLTQLGGSTSVELGTIIREITSSNIVLRILNDTWGAGYWYFILEYTKTTD